MNDKVDVLTALDNALQRAVERGAAKGSPSYKELREARAAFAELIEAINAAAFNATPLRLNDHQTCIRVKPDYWNSILSALARVKGE